MEKGGGLVVWVQIQLLLKKGRKKSNKHDNHSRGLEKETGGKMLVGTYRLLPIQ